MTSNEVLPCPFCGSMPVLITGGEHFCYFECPDCGAKLPASTGTNKDRDALNAWNTRADMRPSGKWLQFEDAETNAWECSLCHNVWQLEDGTPEENHMNYCHNCGARMSGSDSRDKEE